MIDTSSSSSQVAHDSSWKERIDSVDNLPTLPEVYNELVTELSAADVSMKQVSEVVSRDVAISAKLLQVVNSAYFGVRREIQSVRQAVNYLGADTVKGIVLSAGVYSSAQTNNLAGHSPAELYQRGVTIGTKARFLAFSMGLSSRVNDKALTAGLLHDVGKLVIIAHFREEYDAALAANRQNAIPVHICQERIIGASDAEIGGYLLSKWGLAKGIVEAVAFHHAPSRALQRELNEVAAVHLAYASEYDESHNVTDERLSAFDYVYADELGIRDQLPSIRGLSAIAVSDCSLSF